MSRRRVQPRKASICRVTVFCEDQTGFPIQQRGLLEDRSLSGIGISVPERIAIGTKVRVRGRARELLGIVRYCRVKGAEYLVGVRLDDPDTGWASIGAGL
jgi:hypothetical protein